MKSTFVIETQIHYFEPEPEPTRCTRAQYPPCLVGPTCSESNPPVIPSSASITGPMQLLSPPPMPSSSATASSEASKAQLESIWTFRSSEMEPSRNTSSGDSNMDAGSSSARDKSTRR